MDVFFETRCSVHLPFRSFADDRVPQRVISRLLYAIYAVYANKELPIPLFHSCQCQCAIPVYRIREHEYESVAQ